MITLQLDHKGLERLLGGQTEMEIALRRGVVENFAKHHLKSLLNDEAWKASYEVWSQELNAAIEKRLAELLSPDKADQDARLPNIQYRVGEHVNRAVKIALAEALKERIEKDKSYLTTYVTRNVEHWINQEGKRLIAQVFEQEVKKLVDTRLNELVELEIKRRVEALRSSSP